MFQQIDVTNWGIDWDGPVAEPDSQAVEVPETPQDLHQTIEEHLRAYIDPFMTSDVFGEDIYLQALSLAQSIMSTQT